MRRSSGSTQSSSRVTELLTLSKGAPRHPTEEAHFGRLYPGSYPFGHDPELMAIGCGVWAAVVSIYQKWSKERTVGHEHKTEGRKLKGIQRSTETGLAVEMPSRTVRQASHESIEDSMNSYGSEGNIWCPASDKKIGDPLTQIWAESQVLQLVVSVEEIIVLNAEL
ncbi:hypothetical protein QTP70_007115 [Hemibagrus guttatus]|uniref:Uncharacterized protein n=1 Tax=Hemibagrus guttatus TaxID=175788 RepID=A0AAE0RKJ5_9TELE|nr:hypothetical protein QTP70_007115 [Hemibagrus guttatus]